MENNRRIVLQLIAMGRVTPAEAERLLVACSDGRETLWALAAAAGLYLLAHADQLAASFAGAAHALLPAYLVTIQHGLTLAKHLLGGIQ